MNVEILSPGLKWVDRALYGMTVTYSMPAGCALRRSTDMQSFEDVVTPPPFVHTGAPVHYCVYCDDYAGTPITAMLKITG